MARRWVCAIVLVLMLAGCGGGGGRGGGGEKPAAKPFLVFDRDRVQIWVGDLDGTAQRKLYDGSDPSVSADGSRVFFQAANAHLASVRPDGSQFTDLGFGGYDIAVSPDGKQIAYGDNGNLTVATADGTNRRELAKSATHPVFARDSKSVLYQANNGISRIDAAGGSPTRIQRGDSYDLPIGEAADGRIIFISNRGPTDGSELYSMASDGSDVKLLVNAAVEGGAVSPDGRSVVYSEYPEGTQSQAPPELRVVDVQSGEVKTYPASGIEPGWAQP